MLHSQLWKLLRNIMALTKISGEIIQNPLSVGIVTITTSLNVGTAVTISSGSVSATAFFGNGSNLTGIATTKNLTVGTRTTSFSISVVGTGMTLTLRSGIGTVNF